jgi:4-hydroxy-tetrahydrodipicolinate synthase
LGEKLDVVALLTEESAGALVVPTIMTAETDRAVEEARSYFRAFGEEITHLMVPVTNPSPQACADHINAVSSASGYRILLQDYPRPTGIEIHVDDLARLSETATVVDAIKEEATGAAQRIASLATRTDVALIGGLGGAESVGYLESGASGLAAGTSVPQLLSQVLALWDSGRASVAQEHLLGGTALIRFETSSSRSVGIRKEHWRRQGILANSAVRRRESSWLPSMEDETRRLLAPWLS